MTTVLQSQPSSTKESIDTHPQRPALNVITEEGKRIFAMQCEVQDAVRTKMSQKVPNDQIIAFIDECHRSNVIDDNERLNMLVLVERGIR